MQIQKIPITIRLGEDIRAEAFHHFILIGFNFPDDEKGEALDLVLVQSSSSPMLLLHAIQALATQLEQGEEQSAKIMGVAIAKTIDHGLARLEGTTSKLVAKVDG